MSYDVFWMPFEPQDGSRADWEVNVSPRCPDSRQPMPDHPGSTRQFQTQADARRYVVEQCILHPLAHGVITIRALHR